MNAPAAPQSIHVPPCTPVDKSTATVACAPANGKWILVATIVGSSLAFMDGSVVNVALPKLQAVFGAGSSGIQWVVQSYSLFAAALLLLGGAVGDRYGRKKAFLSGIALFALASAACALSRSLEQLIVARAFQGIGAALLVPQGLSILSTSFAANERGRVIGIWSAWTSVFSALGPVAGGWLMQVWSWRLIFLLNLPLALFVLLLAPRLPESRARSGDSREQPLDRLGAILATSSFGLIIYSLSLAPTMGWRRPQVLLTLISGILLFAAFLLSQRSRSNAMMPLSLFRSRPFLLSNVVTFLLYGALGGALYVIPFYLIQVRHYSPAGAGGVFLPLIALLFFFSSRVGSLVPSVGVRLLLVSGSLLAGAGFATFAVLDHLPGYALAMLPGVLLLGCGMTLCVAPLTTTVMSSVSEEQAGIASAVSNAISRLSGLVAISIVALVLSTGFGRSLHERLSVSDLPAVAKMEVMHEAGRLRNIEAPKSLSLPQRRTLDHILDEAFLDGFQWVMWLAATGSWLGALCALLLGRNRSQLAS